MVVQNIINQYAGRWKTEIPKRMRLVRELLDIKDGDDNDLIEFDYEAYKQQGSK